MRLEPEHVFARRLLENAGRAADVEHGERFQLVGDRDDREAAAGGDVTEHGVDLVTVNQVAISVTRWAVEPASSTNLASILAPPRPSGL